MSATLADTPERDRRIRERGGDPACLHCQLSLVISDWLEARPEGPLHGMQVAMALGGVIGELLAPCADIGRRMRCLYSVAKEIGEYCGLTVGPPAQSSAPDAEDEAAPRKVH